MTERWHAPRALTGVVAALAITVGVATAAGAHEPVFVTAADATPATGPFLEDGNHSWAVYGVLDAPGSTRGVRTQLTAGQALVVDLLVPARSPEQDLAPADLPRVTIRWPDGATRTLDSDLRIPFDEPFSNTSYVRIAELREPADQTGVYELTVTGTTPARFTLATGSVEGFGGAKRDTEPPPAGGLAAWYAAAPPTAAASTTTTSTTTRVASSEITRSAASRIREGDATDSTGAAWLVGIGIGIATAAGAGALVVRRRRRAR